MIARGIVGDRAGVPKIASPIFKQSFDLRTGQCLDEPSVRLPSYPVQVRDGRIAILDTRRKNRNPHHEEGGGWTHVTEVSTVRCLIAVTVAGISLLAAGTTAQEPAPPVPAAPEATPAVAAEAPPPLPTAPPEKSTAAVAPARPG